MLYQDFSDTRTEPSAFQIGARTFGLHALGGVCAIALLIGGLFVTSRIFPHARFLNGFTTAFGLLNDDEPSVASSRVPAVAERIEPAPAPVVKRRVRIRMATLPPLRTRVFSPPPAKPAPLPAFVEDGPVMMAIAMEPAIATPSEFSLPARPRNPIVKVLAALSFPFRFLGGIFARQNDGDHFETDEE